MDDTSKDLLILVGGFLVLVAVISVQLATGSDNFTLPQREPIPPSTPVSEEPATAPSFFRPFDPQDNRPGLFSFGEPRSTTASGNNNQEIRQIEAELERAERELARVQEELAFIEEHGEQSPYVDIVTFGGVGGARSSDVDREYIDIRVRAGHEGRISLAGWRVESAITNIGVNFPDASYLPNLGTVNSKQVVVLDARDRVFLNTGRSPVGVSFRTNQCTGYFEQFQNFRPSLPRQCPDPELEILDTKYKNILIDNACMDFVERIPTCQIRATGLPITLSNECQESIIDEINYNSCVEKHKDDEDFIGNSWYLYVNRINELWRSEREVIQLLDDAGRVVDVLDY